MWIEVQDASHNNAQSNLSHYFEFSLESFFVFFKYFDIIVNKSYNSQPDGSNEHENDIGVINFCKEKSRNQDGTQDDESSHSGCSLLAGLTLQSQITHGFPHLLIAQYTNDFFAEQKRNNQGGNQRHGCAEGDVLKYPGSRKMKL